MYNYLDNGIQQLPANHLQIPTPNTFKYYFTIILLFITLIAPLGFLDIYRVEVLVLLASLMYLSKPK